MQNSGWVSRSAASSFDFGVTNGKLHILNSIFAVEKYILPLQIMKLTTVKWEKVCFPGTYVLSNPTIFP